MRGDDRLYVNRVHTCYSFLADITQNETNFVSETELSTEGMRGCVLIAEDNVVMGG